MTQFREDGRTAGEWSSRAGAPWPLVERRAQPRPLDLGDPVARIPRQAGEANLPPVRRVLHPEQHTSARWRSQVVLGDLLGVVLLLGPVRSDRPAAVALAVVWSLLIAAVAVGAQEERTPCQRTVLSCGGGLVLGSALLSYATGISLPREQVLLCLPLAVLLSAGVRTFPRRGLHRRVVLVGSAEVVAPTIALLGRGPGVSVVGVCCPAPPATSSSIAGAPLLGDLDDLGPMVRSGGIDAVVVCSTAETAGPVLRRVVWDLEGSGVPVLVAPGIVELGPGRLRVTTLTDLPLLLISDPTQRRVRLVVKHTFDRLAAAVGLIAVLPLLTALAVGVRCTTPGPALFRQVRIGQDGRAFTLLKFRSMHQDAEERLSRVLADNKHAHGPLFKARSDPRVTPFGRFLRRTSLDELPQIANVLCGHMSLVGPRPPLPHEVARYSDAVPRRLMVRPGLTGLWQVSGRSDLDWDESARLDLWYVENWSFGLDLSILRRTVIAVARGRGAY